MSLYSLWIVLSMDNLNCAENSKDDEDEKKKFAGVHHGANNVQCKVYIHHLPTKKKCILISHLQLNKHCITLLGFGNTLGTVNMPNVLIAGGGSVL